jgi:hypothetical protein
MKLLGAVLLTIACICGVMALGHSRSPRPEAPRAEPQLAQLQQSARVIFITLDGPVRDDVLSGPPDVAVFASWSRLTRAASSRDGVVFVDAPEDGPVLDGGPRWRDARFDAETFTRARAHWEAHHPRFLHLALLDTDEWAHKGLRAEYEQALRDTDARIVEVLGWVAALPPEEAAFTTVLLSSDHGRGTSDWTKHGFFEAGSGEIFSINESAATRASTPGGHPTRSRTH